MGNAEYMGVIVRQSRQEDKMQFLVLATVATLAYGRPQAVLPAGLTAAACPNYPFCGAQSPADFPVPVVNGEPVAPVLNTTPDQTRYYQEAQLVRSWPQDTTLFLLRLTHMKTTFSSHNNNSSSSLLTHRQSNTGSSSRRLKLPDTLAACK